MAETTPGKLTDRHTSEIASAPRATWLGFPDSERISPHIVRSEGFIESTSAWPARGVYQLFEVMEDKDPHLFSLLQTRKQGVLARSRTVNAAGEREEDSTAARWVEGALTGIADWDEALMHLLGALGQGMAVLEVIWGFDARGRAVPVKLAPRNAGRFAFGDRGEIRILEAPGALGGRIERTGGSGDANRETRTVHGLNASGGAGASDPWRGTAAPERKFIVMRFGASDERPYGRGLLERLYWYWWFKKTNLKFWVMYNEKFGAPTVVARHDPGLNPEERDRLLDVISSLQADAAITLPEGIHLELLESARRGSAETYRDLADWCNEQMSRAVLGQTLSVSEGRRGGSLAMARVHEAVRFDYVRSDACRLMNVINGQLVRWMMDFNFGTDVPAPRWKIDLKPEVDLEVEAGIDRQLLQMGVPLPLRYFHEKYGRPAAVEGERGLRYDDSNLFQYHLQFGVLTVNEVRTSLGLPPVAWGDQPTSPVDASNPSPTPGRSTGGASNREPSEQEGEEEREDERDER